MKSKYRSIALAATMMAALTSSVYAEQKPVYDVDDGHARGVRVTYNYLPDSHFKLHTQMGYVNDIELGPGEAVTYIAGGDTQRWMIDKAMVGNTQHVYIKPLDKGVNTNIIINTNQRSYRFDVVETEGYDPLITFRFPDDKGSRIANTGSGRSFSASSKATLRNIDGVQINRDKLNFNYTIEAKKKMDKDLIPLEVFDDGEKTFIKMSANNKYDLPVVYSIDPWDKKKLSMVNYRVRGEYYVVDRVMEHGRLFYHQNFYVDFYNGKVKPMEERVIKQDAATMKRRALYEMDGGEEVPTMSVAQQRENERLIAAQQKENERLFRERQLAQQDALRRQQEAQIALQKQAEKERIAREKERIAREKEQQRLLAERQAQIEAQKELQRKAQLQAEKERIAREKALAKEQEGKLREQARLEAERQAEQQRLEAARKAELERRQREAEKARAELATLQEKEVALNRQIQDVTARLNGIGNVPNAAQQQQEAERQRRIQELAKRQAERGAQRQQALEQQARQARAEADREQQRQQAMQQQQFAQQQQRANARQVAARPLVQPPVDKGMVNTGNTRFGVQINPNEMITVQDAQGNRQNVPFSALPRELQEAYVAQKYGRR